ncbi:hypothetical protein BD289DRAFT_459118 [Coniella lustricola]|uniref:ubiquitinyl hydrolase 1 n=1 Tax=Coniella lustricola TaxID=2025994 RepID=A0A2T3AG40_9PEZI|nr:hypothetical protein BD289DRAFT_459118 [Coniella lustricola]
MALEASIAKGDQSRLSIAWIEYSVSPNRAASRGRPLPTIVELLWDAVVYIIPTYILYTIDRWVNPSLFPTPMLQSQPATHAAKSDALRRILRVDEPGGIVASVSEAGRRAYTSTFSGLKHNTSSQPAGLGNWDNSCFQNSVLQGLASLEHLPRYLAGLVPGQAPSSNDVSTTAGALHAFFADLNDASNNGKTLWTPGVLKNMSTIQQQDAQEYFSRLLDQVDKDIEKGAKASIKPPGFEVDSAKDDATTSQHSDDSGYQSLPMLSNKAGSELISIRNPLEGLAAQRVACTTCAYSEGLSMIPFNCLTLNFEVNVGKYDLFELLDNYVELEFISNVDCMKCTLVEYRKGLQQIVNAVPAAAERLKLVEEMLEEDQLDDESFKKLRIPGAKKAISTKTKQIAIGRPPRSLVMHMNRSVFDPATFRAYKNMAAVQFPTTLDLGPWCVGSATGVKGPLDAINKAGNGRPSNVSMDEEQWVLDATASMVAGDRLPSRVSGPIYELRAVVTHYGRHENGHYVCYKKHPLKPSNSTDSAKSQDQPEQGARTADHQQSPDTENSNKDKEHEVNNTNLPLGALDGEYTGSQWWRLSDETVYEVSEEDVLSQGGVFMLFYDCVDPNSILVTAEEAADVTVPTAAALTKDNDEISEAPSASGRKSPAWSEASITTLCNTSSADQTDAASEVSSATLIQDQEEDQKYVSSKS